MKVRNAEVAEGDSVEEVVVEAVEEEEVETENLIEEAEVTRGNLQCNFLQ